MLCTDMDLRSFLNPWRELERHNSTSNGSTLPSSSKFPAINIWLGADSATLTAEVPGLIADDIEISLAGKTLTLSGSKKINDAKETDYRHRERWHGQFSKTFELPFNIEYEKVAAGISNGVLHIELPRAESEKPRKISVISE